MKHDVKAPSVGESVTEVSILKWVKQDGEAVETGDPILEIESDKATVELVAEHAGVLKVVKNQGERVPVGEKIGYIDDSLKPTAATAPKKKVSNGNGATHPSPTPASTASTSTPQASTRAPSLPKTDFPMSPSARKLIVEKGLDPKQILSGGPTARLTKEHITQAPNSTSATSSASVFSSNSQVTRPGQKRVPMSMLRQKIAERLKHAQNTAAMLTTFNEVDMTAVMRLRTQHKDAFKAKHGVSLGFMSFFSRASVLALQQLPNVNASVDGKDVLYHDYVHLGVAVGTDRGLVVPVLKHAEKMSFADIEKGIAELAARARDGKLSIADMSDGTFTISNGGVYGSLLSTPILNPPQSAILGMHNIQQRPVVVEGKIEARPMMYVALSYDHRIIDGKGAVTFLVTLKDALENPEKLGFSL